MLLGILWALSIGIKMSLMQLASALKASFTVVP